MVTITSERYSVMQEKLLQSLKDFDYRFKRYHVCYSIAVGHSPTDIDLTLFANHIRATDRFISLDHHTCAIIFDGTNDESGIKAANNLLSRYHTAFYATPLFAGIVTASNYCNTATMAEELFGLLDYAIAHNMNSIIIDPSQVIQHNKPV